MGVEELPCRTSRTVSRKRGSSDDNLEAIADDRLWIWHAFFGMPGCLNDINVLDASPLFNKVVNGTYPTSVRYKIAGVHRTIPYWLADGIYPRWPPFVLMAYSQERRRKDVERAFGVLQSRWHIIARPCRLWGRRKMKMIMMRCIILYNIMVEVRFHGDSRGMISSRPSSNVVVGEDALPMYALQRSGCVTVPPPGTIAALCAAKAMTNKIEEYFRTKHLVMEHSWAEAGNTSV